MPVQKPDINAIRRAIENDNFEIRDHAYDMLEERGISLDEVVNVVLNGTAIEFHPNAYMFPKCLIVGHVRNNIPLYVSIGYDEVTDIAYIITVHWQNPELWLDNFTRKPKKSN